MSRMEGRAFAHVEHQVTDKIPTQLCFNQLFECVPLRYVVTRWAEHAMQSARAANVGTANPGRLYGDGHRSYVLCRQRHRHCAPSLLAQNARSCHPSSDPGSLAAQLPPLLGLPALTST